MTKRRRAALRAKTPCRVGRRRGTARITLSILGVAVVLAPTGSAKAASGLVVSIQVDKVLAVRGDVLAYTIEVENGGDTPVTEVEVFSHIPEHTTEAPAQDCPQSSDTCVNVDVGTPGLGDNAHQIHHRRIGILPAGAVFGVRFWVRVDDDAPLGSHLLNHAHALAAPAPQVTSAPVDTLVTDRLAGAMFGRAGFTASGGLVTDGFDSSVGPYEVSRDVGGNIASNGDISVSGGSVINGDATPGPGRVVIVSRNSTVSGDTSAASTAIRLNDVRAEHYASANDDGRICRVQSDCSSTVFDARAQTLVIGGSAALTAGAYYLCLLDVAGTLTVTGPVTVFIGSPEACGGRTDQVQLRSSGRVVIAGGRTSDFQVQVQGSPLRMTWVRATGHAVFAGELYAPASGFVLAGGSAIFGSAVAGELAAGAGGAFVHYDRAASN